MATDQEIRDAGFKYIPQQQYLQSPFKIPTAPEEMVTDSGIVATNAFTGGGGGGGDGYYPGSPNNLLENYQTILNERQNRLNTPSNTFLGFNTRRNQQLTGADLGEYIGSGTDVPQELTMAGQIQEGLGGIKEGIGSFASKIGGFGPISFALNAMDRFNTLSPVDRQFIEQNMGYTGPTVFGENTSGLSKDIYGINTRSLFGNYADYVEDKAAEYADIDDDEFDKLSKFQQQKITFYREKQKELQKIQEAEIEKQKQQAQSFMDKNPNYGNPELNINPGSGGGKGYDPQHDYSGTSTKDKHDRAADLGFSDIRLKENVELIGKSPSNINIYKFNYKNSPTTYQGAMAHEVPWASVKHSNGYMMVDYNKIDVKFKKI